MVGCGEILILNVWEQKFRLNGQIIVFYQLRHTQTFWLLIILISQSFQKLCLTFILNLEIYCSIDQLKSVIIKTSLKYLERNVILYVVIFFMFQKMNLFEFIEWYVENFWLFGVRPCYFHLI